MYWRGQHWAFLGKEPTHLEGRDSHQNSPCSCDPGTDTQLYLTCVSWTWVPESGSHGCYPPSENKQRSLELPWLAQGYRSVAVSQMERCVFGEGGEVISERQKTQGHVCTSSEAHRTVQGWGWALRWLWIRKASLTSWPSPRHLSSLPRVTHQVLANWTPVLMSLLVSFT